RSFDGRCGTDSCCRSGPAGRRASFRSERPGGCPVHARQIKRAIVNVTHVSEDCVAVERYLAQRTRPPLPARIAGRIGSRLTVSVDFAVVDGASLPYEPGTFDLVTQCNMPPFIAEVARVLRPGGSHVIADSLGSGTPSFTPRRILRRAVERCGLQTIADGRAG